MTEQLRFNSMKEERTDFFREITWRAHIGERPHFPPTLLRSTTLSPMETVIPTPRRIAST